MCRRRAREMGLRRQLTCPWLGGLDGIRTFDDKEENLEPNFPLQDKLRTGGEEMTATIYAFKKDRADAYRKKEGIIFTLNGQTHGHLSKEFFTRKNAGRLGYIANDLLVIVDCSRFSTRSRDCCWLGGLDGIRTVALATT